MAFKPRQYLDDDITNPGDLVSAEAFTALADNANFLIDAMQVGSLICVLVGYPNCPQPDATIWQLCDGSPITDESSPLFGQLTPNYADEGRYMRHPDVVGTIGTYNGSNFKDLRHSHGGQTNPSPQFLTKNVSDDNNASRVGVHTHGIAPDLGLVDFQPEHITVNHYVKIR